MVQKSNDFTRQEITIDPDECLAFFTVGVVFNFIVSNITPLRPSQPKPVKTAFKVTDYPSMDGLVSILNIMAIFDINPTTVKSYEYRIMIPIPKDQFILNQKERYALKQINGGVE